MQKDWTENIGGAEFKIMRLQEAPYVEATDTPEKTALYIRDQIKNSIRFNPDTENLGIVYLNTRRRPIGLEIISNGTLDTLLVHPREVFKSAIVLGAAAIVMFHNHPSGDPTPSEGDIRVTREIIRGGQILKIELLDHIVLGQKLPGFTKDFCSLKELGYFLS